MTNAAGEFVSNPLIRLDSKKIKILLNTLLILAFLIVARHSWEYQKRTRGYKEQIVELESELEKMRAEAASLRERVNKLESDPATIEREGRERLKMLKPGEEFLEPETAARNPASGKKRAP